MTFKIGDIVKCKFGNGTIRDVKKTETMNFYKIELSDGGHKGKMPWFAEHELEKITYEVPEEKIINPGFEGEESYE